MNFFRKFGNWLWNSKERLVLALLVIVLCYRVYMVVNPQDLGEFRTFRDPRGGITVDEIDDLPKLRPAPLIPPGQQWRPLWRDPLWAWNTERSQVTAGDLQSGEERIELLNIQVAGDNLMAQIQVGRSKKWYREGQEFFTYTLLSIDKDTNCCAVFSEARGRPIEICIDE